MHYICTGGCRGESDVAKTCDDAACSKYEMELNECDCHDGEHYGTFQATSTKTEDEEDTDKERLYR